MNYNKILQIIVDLWPFKMFLNDDNVDNNCSNAEMVLCISV